MRTPLSRQHASAAGTWSSPS
ncbi:rCG24067 [Rattus norvegicus]|uniref:RCG24067 n=1 Tax=Rattus norvegicus TaxID=10116 RepID=A6JSW2_RAT|nr:rCG24067 [Rattus norvegicus]